MEKYYMIYKTPASEHTWLAMDDIRDGTNKTHTRLYGRIDYYKDVQSIVYSLTHKGYFCTVLTYEANPETFGYDLVNIEQVLKG